MALAYRPEVNSTSNANFNPDAPYVESRIRVILNY